MAEINIKEIQNAWFTPILMGAVMLVIGILLAVMKQEALKIIIMAAGVLLIIVGQINAYIDFKNNSFPILGAIMIVVGIVLVVLPNLITNILMALLAIVLIFYGLVSLLQAVRDDTQSAFNKAFYGVIAAQCIILGVYALMNLHDTQDIVMIIIGIVFAITGGLDLIAQVKSFMDTH